MILLFDISINIDAVPLDLSKFSYERILDNFKNSFVFQGFETLDGSIIYNIYNSGISLIETIDENKNKIWKLDSMNTLGVLKNIDFSNFYFYSFNNLYQIKTYNNSVQKTTFNNNIEYAIYINPNFGLIISNYKIFSNVFSLNFTIFDNKFKQIDQIKLYENRFGHYIEYYYLNIDLDFLNYRIPYIFKYNIHYSIAEQNGSLSYYDDYALYLGNKKLSTDANINFKSYIRLNDKMCVVSYTDNTIRSYDSASNEIWKINLNKK